MRAMALKLIGIPLAGNADHKSELPIRPRLDSLDGVFDEILPALYFFLISPDPAPR